LGLGSTSRKKLLAWINEKSIILDKRESAKHLDTADGKLMLSINEASTSRENESVLQMGHRRGAKGYRLFCTDWE